MYPSRTRQRCEIPEINMTITVVGNQELEFDSNIVNFLPKLRELFSEHTFIHQDPTENLTIPKDNWLIIDVAQGLSEITVFADLKHFTKDKSLTAHDYDLYTDLMLLQKTNQLPAFSIIAVPMEMTPEEIEKKLPRILKETMSKFGPNN